MLLTNAATKLDFIVKNNEKNLYNSDLLFLDIFDFQLTRNIDIEASFHLPKWLEAGFPG